eukprot:2343158-Rhodomonas_salina.3
MQIGCAHALVAALVATGSSEGPSPPSGLGSTTAALAARKVERASREARPKRGRSAGSGTGKR